MLIIAWINFIGSLLVIACCIIGVMFFINDGEVLQEWSNSGARYLAFMVEAFIISAVVVSLLMGLTAYYSKLAVKGVGKVKSSNSLKYKK